MHFSIYNKGRKVVILTISAELLFWFIEVALIAFYDLDRITKYRIWFFEEIHVL